MRLTCSSIALTAVGLLWGLAAPCGAQELLFEQVGDQPFDAKQIQFDADGSLWAIEISALWHLSPTENWEEVGNGFGHYLLVLSPDTLFRGTIAGTHRSTDGGETFDFVYEEGGDLFSADPDGPNAGLILCGSNTGGTGIAYSTDRGATFTESTFTVSTSSESTLHSAAEIPDGPAAGRLVAGVFNGIVVSDDGGQTWAPSSLFQDFRYSVRRVVIGEEPQTGERRLYATVTDSQAPGPQLYMSDDDGLTWTNVPGLPDVHLFVFVPQGAGYLLAVERGYDLQTERIELWRSEDGGQTWFDAGRLPAVPKDDGLGTDDMLIGPDGHVYIAVGRTGPEAEWVYRSTEPVVVASEPQMPPEPMVERLLVYPNPASDRITVEAVGEEAVLYALLGRAVLRSRLVYGKAVLDTSRLSAGVYVVRVGGESRMVTIRR